VLFHIRRIRCVGLFCIGVLGCFIFAGSGAISYLQDQVCWAVSYSQDQVLFHIRRIRCVGLFCIGVLGCFIFAGSVAISYSQDQVCWAVLYWCVGLFHIRRISCCFKFARSGVFHIRRIRCLMKKPTILAVKTTPHIDTGDAS